MAIAVRNSISQTVNNNTTLTATKPTGTAEGDLLIALFDANAVVANPGTITLPSGWTLLRRDDQSNGGIFWAHHIAYKTAGASEPSTYAFSFPAVCWWRFALVALSGAGAIEANSRTYTPSTVATQIPLPTVTTLGADRMVLYLAARYDNIDSGDDPPAGFTELQDLKNTAIGQGSLSVGYKTQAVAGATGALIVTATSGSAGTPAVGYMLSISPVVTVTDSASGTVTASGTGSESRAAADSASGTITASGAGVESHPGVAFRSAGALSAVAGTITASYPSGVASGDMLLMQALVYGLEVDTGMATPSGWTKLLGPVALHPSSEPYSRMFAYLFTRTAGASEPTTVVLTCSEYGQAKISAYSGCDPTTPIDAFSSAAVVATGIGPPYLATSPPVTTTRASRLLRLYWIIFPTAVTPATGDTERYDFRGDIGITLWELADQAKPTPGAAGASDVAGDSVGGGVAATIALADAGPPVAAFSVAPRAGHVPFNAVFTDASANTPTAWAWNFGDGGTSTSQNPTHNYATAGTYTVSLTATNAYGSNTKTRTAYITAANVGDPLPTALLTGSAQVAFKAVRTPQPFDPNPALGELVYHYFGSPHGYSRVPAAGGTITPLGTMAGFSPSWGPDGRIVFQGDSTPLVIVDGDGSNPVDIPGTTNCLFPSWSPDGSKILAVRATDYAIVWLDPITGAATVVANATREFTFVILGSQAWHPAGNRIVFTDSYQSRVYTVNLDGTGLSEVPTVINRAAGEQVYVASWSPLATHIAISADSGLYITRLGGNTHRRFGAYTSVVAWSPDGKRLAFNDDDGGLNVMNADGTGRTRIVNDAGVNAVTWTRRRGSGTAIEMTAVPNYTPMQGQSQLAITVGPRPTPHDTQPGLGAILYNGRGSDSSWTVFRVPPIAGGGAIDIWTQTWGGNTNAYNPAWGPDGRVAFSVSGLVMADGDGTNPVAVEGGEFLDYPSWSPDGSTILAYDYDDIVAVDLRDGSRRVVLAASSFNVNLSAQAWNPNQTQIVFTDGYDDEVWVVNADGTGLTEITPIGVGALASPVSFINFAAWSPDGDELAICDRHGLHISDTEGNNARHIYTAQSVWTVAWSPDGKRLAIVNNVGVAVMKADGTGFTQVNTDSTARVLDWSRQQPPIALTGVVGGAGPAPTTVTMTGHATIGLFAVGDLEYPDLGPRVSGTFYDRWRSGLHIGDARPGMSVRVRRGRFHRRHATWNGPPMPGVQIPGFAMVRPWQPFWTPTTSYIDVPNVREIRLDQTQDQNGITTATLVIDNIYYRPEAAGHHSIKRGFMAPLRGYVGPGRTRLVDEQGEPVNEDPTWFSLLAQDAQITVHQSYGDQEIKTFTGLIDEVDVVSSPDVITITARDFGKTLTESHLYGWNKEWPLDTDTGFLLDPITFADPDDADDIHSVGYDATASSGSGASNVLDTDGDTTWTSNKHTATGVTEYVQVRLPQGRYNDFTVNLESDDLEMYVSLLPKNLKDDSPPTRNGVAISDNQWVGDGSGNTVPGDNGGIRYIRHLTGISKGTHRYHLTSDADDFRVGADSILRLSFRHLDRAAGSTGYTASVVRVTPYRRTLSADARRRHWVLVDDASDVVRVMLRWAGFKEWEVEDTGTTLSEKFIVNRGMTYMDVIKRMADVSGYTFFMSDPTSRSNSLGLPIYRRTQIVTNAAPVVTVRDTELLGPINVRESDEPLAYIIRMRGRVAPNKGSTIGGDKTKRLMYVYQPPWTVREGGNQLGGILRHVIHTDDLFKTLDDCKFACYYLALNEALAALTATIQIPANPGIQLDDHVEVFDLGTGVSSRLSIQQRSSQFTRSGEETLWTMTLGGALVDTLDVQAVVLRINTAKRA